MIDYLVDFSIERLARANEENLAAWIPVFSRLEGAQLDGIPGVRRSITNIPSPLFNSVAEARLTLENVDSTIELVQEDATQRKVPVIWWIGPSTRPDDLANRLLARGFVIDEDGPGMAVELDHLNETLSFPHGLSVQKANDEASWQSWGRTMMLGFEAPEARIEFGTQQWQAILRCADPEIVQAYTAWLDGKPVATSLMLLGAGVAGIYGVATLPEARRKGIGAQVTLHPLLQARMRGYKVGILQASEMGLPVYRSLGFHEVCRITSYVWRPT